MAVEYKFKPYSPKNLKMATVPSTSQDALKKSLESQRKNLEKRLLAEGIDPNTLGGEFDNRNFLEKALNLKPDQGMLLDFFEVINRPVEAIKAGISAGVDGKDVLAGAWEGLSGEVVTPGSELLEKTGVLDAMGYDLPQEGVGRFVADVATDILLDPLNLIPPGYLLKKFGKLMSKSKLKIFKQFTGNFLNIVNSIDNFSGSGLYAFKNMDEFDTFIKNAPVDEINHIKTRFDELAGKGNIFKKGQKGRKADFKYENTFEELKQRATDLEEYVKKADEIELAYKNKQITEDQYIEQMNAALPDSFDKTSLKRYEIYDADGNLKRTLKNPPRRLKDGETVTEVTKKVKGYRKSNVPEINLYDDTQAVVKSYGSEYDSVLNKTSNRIDDVTIVREVKIGDETYYVKVLGIEAKNADDFMLASATMMFKYFNEFDTGPLPLRFSDSDRARSFTPEIQRKFTNLVKKKIKVNGVETTIEDAVRNIYNSGTRTGEGATLRIFKLLQESDPTAAGELKDLMIQMFKQSNPTGMVYLGSNILGAKGLYANIDDLKNIMNFDSMFIGWTKSGSTNQFRMMGNVVMDFDSVARDGMKGLEVLISEGKVQLTRDIIEAADNLVDVERTMRVNIFEYYKDKPGLIGDFSKVGAKFIAFMKDKFSAYGFLTDELATAARRLKGETAIQYQTRMLRLANLRDSFLARFPNLSDRYLSELVEAGAHIDAVTGAIVFADRTIPMEEYLAIVISANEQGLPAILRKFGSGADNRFIKDLNEAAGTALGTIDIDYFRIVEKNGKKVLEADLTAEQLQRILLEVKQNPNFIGKQLNWGRYDQVPGSALRLSADAENVLRNWEDYENFVNLHHDVQQILATEGGYYNFLTGAGEVNDTYLRHIMTKEAYEYMSKNQPGVLSEWAKPGSNFFKERRYLGTIEEVNDYLKAIYNLDMEVFDPSAFRAAEDFFKHAFRNIEQGKLMTLLLEGKNGFGEGLLRIVENTRDVRKGLDSSEIMFKSFKEEFSSLYKNLSPSHQEALNAYLLKNGMVGNGQAIVMNKTMHRLIKESEKAFTDLPTWLKMYDGFLNTWKGLTLVTPGFHLRNLFGNSFNSYAVGMDTISQLKYSRLAMLEMSQFDEAVKILADGGTLSPRLQKVYDTYTEFQRNGLIQSHRGVRDLEQAKEAAELAAKGDLKGARKLYNDAIRLNFNIAEKMDDFQRYMLYRWALDKTGDSTQAAKTVIESLFDYSALTGFEKDVMKRIFPFYTFMKNNFIFQAKNILRNPAQYAKVGRAYNYYLEDIAGYSAEDLPDYATENMWIPLPAVITKNDKEGIAFLKANLPLTDFIELVENPFKKGVISVTVPIKLPIELGIGRDLFTGAPITDFPGQTNVMAEGTGVLSGIRNERGQVALARTPLMQKILNDIGLRTPLNFATIGVDLVDTLTGYQGPQSGLTDFLERTGVAGAQDLERLELTRLYQDLEHLRELKKLYEQETGYQLPILPRG